MTGLTNEQVQERIAEGKQADHFGKHAYIF